MKKHTDEEIQTKLTEPGGVGNGIEVMGPDRENEKGQVPALVDNPDVVNGFQTTRFEAPDGSGPFDSFQAPDFTQATQLTPSDDSEIGGDEFQAAEVVNPRAPRSFAEMKTEKHRPDIENHKALQAAIDVNLTALFYTARRPASVHEKYFYAHSISDPAEQGLVALWFDRASTGDQISQLQDWRDFEVDVDRSEMLLTTFMARYGVRIGKLRSIRSSILDLRKDVRLNDFYAF